MKINLLLLEEDPFWYQSHIEAQQVYYPLIVIPGLMNINQHVSLKNQCQVCFNFKSKSVGFSTQPRATHKLEISHLQHSEIKAALGRIIHISNLTIRWIYVPKSNQFGRKMVIFKGALLYDANRSLSNILNRLLFSQERHTLIIL